MLSLAGIVPSLNTPFTEQDQIDDPAIGRLVDSCADAGCGGLLALAVAGETGSLDADEYACVLDAVMARCAGRLPVVVGVSAAERATSLERAHLAAAAGALAVLWQPPLGLPEDRLEAMLFELGEAGPGAVMLQDLDWQGSGLSIAAIVRLCERVPALQAIKIETVHAGPKYSAVLEATAGRLQVSGGWAVTQMLEALERGVHAFMPTGMEAVYCAIYRCFTQGQVEAARDLFEAALPVLVFANQHIDVSIRFLKQLRVVQGLFATDRCRPPVAQLDRFQQRSADRLARRAQALEGRIA
jgi:dihydrodipicolinate synthase/N-acetylneuraminate lyase